MQSYPCPVCKNRTKGKRINNYIECGICSCYYLEVMPPDSFFRTAIKQYGKRIKTEAVNSKLRKIPQQRLRDISLFIKPRAKILDVGSGMGQFIRYAQRHGYRVAAMDKALPCVTYLRSLGIPSYTNLARIPNHSFDAVTLFDVIEHIKNPYPFLAAVRKKLKKNSILMITTPNTHGISSLVLPSLLTSVPGRYSEHAVLYSPRSLTRLLQTAGFTPITKTTDIFLPWSRAENFWMRKIINKSIYLVFLPFLPYLFTNNLGDNIQIIAKVSKEGRV